MDRRRVWYVFRAFNLYRLILAVLLLALFYVEPQNRLLGKTNPPLFLGTTLTYMALVMLSIVGSYQRRPSLNVQAHVQTLIDLIGLSLLIHVSGGITSNLSMLLVMAVAASGILLPLPSALLAAALAFFLQTASWLYTLWKPLLHQSGATELGQLLGQTPVPTEELGRLGFLGASCFLATLLTYTLAERTRRSEELSRQRSQELLAMAGLNQAIVQHLQSGVIVVDCHARIRLINDMARDLLDHRDDTSVVGLREVSPALNQRLESWLQGTQNDPRPFRQAEHLPDLIPQFKALDNRQVSDTLIFLEDSSQVAQRLQQIKLAALGRLTASIAHEIRNPLAAISHAAQLLAESPGNPLQQRLAQIIHNHTKRANEIIANVQSLSRRDQLKLEDFRLQPWLEEFRQEFLRSQGDNPPVVDLRMESADLEIRFDVSQLWQILWNLCANACLHGALPGQPAHLRLFAGRTLVSFFRPRAFLEVLDSGPGIAEADLEKIFEPFFTTKRQGTGLGLYIAREMCEANGAQLQYLRPPEGGSCFRLTFNNASQ